MKKDNDNEQSQSWHSAQEESQASQNVSNDYYSLIEGVDLPPLPLEGIQLFEDSFKQEINNRIRRFTKNTGIIDTVAQGAYVMLELCAEKHFLSQIIERDRAKIKQLESRQKRILAALQNLLKHIQDVSFKANLEK